MTRGDGMTVMEEVMVLGFGFDFLLCDLLNSLIQEMQEMTG